MSVIDKIAFAFSHLVVAIFLAMVALFAINEENGIFFVYLLPMSFAVFLTVPFAIIRAIMLWHRRQPLLLISYLLMLLVTAVCVWVGLSDYDSAVIFLALTLPASMFPIVVLGWISFFARPGQRKAS
ncbi:hypothetical protein QVA66_08800 [Staphylococcus chromogenes]|nr:hypothetical protein [Staphylococcus chromogenes]